MDNRNPIFRSLGMIEEKIHEKLTVETLASGVHFSKYHYQRLFREAVGDSVMGYVARRRIALAAEELVQSQCTILDLALKYGYDSHEGFTRSFKSYMGVTPAEYRKYCLRLPQREKEKNAMMYSKATDEMMKELNGLIAEAGETAAYTRKHRGDAPEAAFYGRFWEFAAGRAERMAEQLKEMRDRITAIAGRPDEISARFLIVKAVEDAVFEAGITAFQVGLTMARAMPEHREKFAALCEKYDTLAGHARKRAEKIAGCFNELAALIFRDMRKQAAGKMQKAAAAGRDAAKALAAPALPYGYLAEEVGSLAEGFESLPLEEVTLSWLEDELLRLETAAFAAEVDALRAPSDSEILDGISNFGERVRETLEFFRSLPGEEGMLGEDGRGVTLKRTEEKKYGDLATQERILLFYLKGEIRKLDTCLDAGQRDALEAVGGRLGQAVEMARRRAEGAGEADVAGLLRAVYDEMTSQAERLGAYGGPVRYLAEAVKAPLQYLK